MRLRSSGLQFESCPHQGPQNAPGRGGRRPRQAEARKYPGEALIQASRVSGSLNERQPTEGFALRRFTERQNPESSGYCKKIYLDQSDI